LGFDGWVEDQNYFDKVKKEKDKAIENIGLFYPEKHLEHKYVMKKVDGELKYKKVL
jgi:hypothetical protein